MNKLSLPLKAVIVTMIVLIALAFAGCPKDPYRASIQGSYDVAESVHSATVIATSYYANGLVNDQERDTLANVLKVVTNANMVFRKCAVDAHTLNSKGLAFVACADVFTSQVSTLNLASIGFKDPKAQAAISKYILAVKAAIDGIGLAIQSAKGATK